MALGALRPTAHDTAHDTRAGDQRAGGARARGPIPITGCATGGCCVLAEQFRPDVIILPGRQRGDLPGDAGPDEA